MTGTFRQAVATAVLLMVTVVDQLSAAGCKHPFTYYNHACHYISTTTIENINGAIGECRRLGGYLLNVDARKENDYIVSELNNIQKSTTWPFDGYWIGAFYNSAYSRWEWRKQGTSRPIQFRNTYTNWATGEPDNFYYGQEKSTAMIRDYGYRWKTEDGALPRYRRMGFICEYDL